MKMIVIPLFDMDCFSQYIRKQDQEQLLDQYGSPKDSPARLEIRATLQEAEKSNTIRKLFNL
jgi:hypothetical protein